MKIAITTASGRLAHALVPQFVRAVGDRNVIGIARNVERAQDLGIEIRPGDYDNRAHFDTALRDVEILVLIPGYSEPAVRIVQHKAIIDAAKTAGVRKIVFTGVIGPPAGTTFSAIVNSILVTEEYIKSSGLEWVLGRNGIYIEPDVESMDEYKAVGKIVNCAAGGRCAYTTRAELAVAYREIVTDDQHNGKTYNLTGTAITQDELAHYLNRTFGCKLGYQSISVEEYERERTAAIGSAGPVVSGIYAGIRMGAFDVPSNFAQAAGRPHISWNEYFRELKETLS